MEAFGLLWKPREGLGGGDGDEGGDAPCGYVGKVEAVVEFSAGRGYLTQMLADCCGIRRMFLEKRRSYKLKADQSLRQKESVALERLRIDIEDLNLSGIESLRRPPYLAIGKHLCGPAIDLTLRCYLSKEHNNEALIELYHINQLRGLALAACCHHLCQRDQYRIGRRSIVENGNFMASVEVDFTPQERGERIIGRGRADYEHIFLRLVSRKKISTQLRGLAAGHFQMPFVKDNHQMIQGISTLMSKVLKKQ